ncbi:branched-chain amino acid ABC transporter permease [Bdellovibrio svalbardensis]|uniref:Branched-chain amino acid ABC transporter permease n=1 Tax=Bdellovibrio svalbardensis TaxID=2972972 RepID=A0ABT6DEV6_9BACT|nr:branched-chain amino acid ABC transporter permease [Bdellovibrio svalbardensis]MDG0815370.1 branched-chain amino acid ABC transporter permease [Bdellovibrio svalbardensis]
MIKSFKNPILALIGLALVGFGFEMGFDAYIQLIILFITVNCLMSMSLNMVNGYTGQFSLGHAGFMAIGAYFSAYASTKWNFLPPNLTLVSSFIFAIGSGLVAAAAGFIVGLPSLRLKGDYLAIVTLGFGEIIRVALLNMDFLGGPRGYANIPSLGSFFSSFGFASVWLVICFFTIWRVMHSSYGRGFLSVREDEIAAESVGINTTNMKVRAFVLSSFFAGVAGALFAHFTNFINPSSFTFLTSVNAVIMVVLGGMGSMTGSIVAAIFITVLPEALRPVQELTGFDLRMVIYSLSLILVMIWRPKGIFGELEITDVWRKYVRRSA